MTFLSQVDTYESMNQEKQKIEFKNVLKIQFADIMSKEDIEKAIDAIKSMGELFLKELP